MENDPRYILIMAKFHSFQEALRARIRNMKLFERILLKN